MIKKRVQWKWVIVATIIFMVFLILVLPQMAEYSAKVIGDFGSPDTSLIYSGADLYDMAESYGESGRAAYIKLRWTLDFVWPFVYTLFFVLWTLKLLGYVPRTSWTKHLVIFPLVAMFLDFMENLGATIVMARYPLSSGLIASLTPLMTSAKWLAISASSFIVAALIIATIIKKVKKPNSNAIE
ncbi:MAG: hypothetical protein RBS51_03400 [Anaerovoracaceae bacterium]|jgi:hypothetical protein|nr:hypothetical protein [Anaerovoracaceae bacterium]